MRINILGNQIKINNNIRSLVAKKLGQKLEKHLPRLNEEIKTAGLHIKKHSRWGYKLKFNMRLPKDKHLFAETKKDNLATALVELRKKLIKQIKKYKQELNYSSD
jgi:ribosomal subunit interface protein